MRRKPEDPEDTRRQTGSQAQDCTMDPGAGNAPRNKKIINIQSNMIPPHDDFHNSSRTPSLGTRAPSFTA